MTVRGIEAIKLYMPPTTEKLNANVKVETGRTTTEAATAAEVSSNAIDIETATTMNSMERYRQEWQQLLKTLEENSENIREMAFDGQLQISKFRSVYWALLLRVLSEDHHTWSVQRQQQRKRYDKLKQEFAKNPHQVEGSNALQEDDDPLSQSSKSVWNQYFSDQELFAVIGQDVVRTFPGVDFFRKPLIQQVMNNILFYYAREHPYMCYRQGMHEILAPVIFVMYGDHQSFLHFKEISKNVDIDETLMDILNPQYLEADAYFIFSRIMASIESYYRVSNGIASHNIDVNSSFVSVDMETNSGYNSEVEVVGQLNLIRDKILAKEDLHLHNYLMKLDIPLHIFGIRWLRLLFGREFALLDLLMLWDAIFADSDRFDLPNYILVAMLIRIRDKLLLSDYTTCLTYLMRYPPNVDIGLVLRHALHMQMPKKYDRPANAFIYFTMPPTSQSQVNKNSTRSNATSTNRGKTDHIPSTMDNNSVGENTLRMGRQITLMQTRNAADEALLARLKATAEENRLAMDGYKDNNPELMRLELRNVQTVVTVARSKLQSYLQTIRQHLPKKQSSTEMAEALDGIEELCQFLDVKFMCPLHARTGPIDQALEANEQHIKLQQHRKEKTESFKDIAKQDLNNMTPTKNINGNNASSFNATREPAFIYEVPDNGFMLHSYSVLGNVKEIEMIPIVSDEKIVDPLNANAGINITASVSNSHNISNGGLPVADPLCLKR